MTITAYELADSRRYDAGEGKASAERTFIIDGAADESAIIAAMDGTILPDGDSLYPSAALLPLDLYFNDFSIAKIGEKAEAWKVVCRYAPKDGAQDTVTTNLHPDEVGYRTVSGNLKAIFVDVWRVTDGAASIAYPTDFLPAIPGSDIGGTKIDLATRPLSTQAFQQTLSVQITDGDIPDMGINGVQGAIGKRNSAKFLGANVGTVVFTGCSFTRVPDVHRFSITYEFAFDPNGHLIQYPALDSNGKIIRNATHNAATVLFRQPFIQTTNFMSLSQYFVGL